ncbi:MAG: hypothetical protein LBU32_11250 [Clostridiales bacterium]|jgi:hypothetical protein|nr:hypothetical protein [Clostridiales bacterium]
MTYEELELKHGDISAFESAENPGWFPIEGKMFGGIKSVLAKYTIPLTSFILAQEKEKFGELRTYWDWSFDDESSSTENPVINSAKHEIDAVIDEAARESANTCWKCGQPATLQSRGWILPFCQTCAEQQNDYPSGFITNFM